MPKNYNALQRLFGGNNYDNLPSISAGNVAYTPVVFQPTAQFTPSQVDTSILERSLGRIEERKNKVNQQRAAIQSALANVKLNSAEDEWKQKYIDKIVGQLDAAAQFGNYSNALSIATKLAVEAISSPELLGRIRYNENREKWINNLETRAARGEIDSDTLARAKYENAYNYQDTYDNNGNIIGGTDWQATFEPVKDLNLSQVMSEIKSLVTPSSTAASKKYGTSQVYLDADGKQTTDVNLARGVFSTKTGGERGSSETGVTAEEWANAYDAWMRMHPEAASQFEQKRKNNIWLYKQNIIRSKDMSLSEEERATAKANADVQYAKMTDENGGLLTPENYARSIASPMFKVMQYNKTVSSSEESSTLLDTNYLKNKTIAEVYNISVADADLWSIGSPAEREQVLKNAANNRNEVNSAAKSSENVLITGFGSSVYVPSWRNE